VHVFGPDSQDIDATVRDLYVNQRLEENMFNSSRTAFFFKPGVYNIDVPVGYYTTVHGLGAAPEDVSFTGPLGVHQAEPGFNANRFWRGAENLATRPASGKMYWSVSQAAPLRRMVIDGDLLFGAEANTRGSGGFVSDLKVTGKVNFTMQQQWILRNCEIGNGTSYFQDPPRSVNFVFVGTTGAPEPTSWCTNSAAKPESPEPQQLVTAETPVSLEKPYITIDAQGKFSLVTPKAATGTRGTEWAAEQYVDGFENVFVASGTTDVAVINAKLAEGLHVVLSPGVYSLPEPIRIGRTGSDYQVLLGLGLATLVPLHGGPAVEIGDAPGVRIAGLLLEAGPVESKALVTVGTSPAAGDAANPILLADVFARVGGPGTEPVSSRVMVEVNASHVVIDNMWLWRADLGINPHRSHDVAHGLVVNGHNVTAYGLASEHTQSDNVVWNGEDGSVYFYQAELDGLAHNSDDKTPDYGPNGVSGYRLNAKKHLGVGMGVYCWFSNPDIIVQSGVKVLHEETLESIICPFQWIWPNENTPPHGHSTILRAIMPVESGEIVV
jgi:hypothetical protein